jgi:hypothetical protein
MLLREEERVMIHNYGNAQKGMTPGEINMPHCCPDKQNFEFIHGVRFRAYRNKYMYGISELLPVLLTPSSGKSFSTPSCRKGGGG